MPALIDRFEAEPQQHERTPADKVFRFVKLNVSHHWPEVEREIGAVMMDCFGRYWEPMQVTPSGPRLWTWSACASSATRLAARTNSRRMLTS